MCVPTLNTFLVKVPKRVERFKQKAGHHVALWKLKACLQTVQPVGKMCMYRNVVD